MTTLSEYLSISDITLTEFARLVGVSKGHMSEIANGTRSASLPVAVKIHEKSGRTVSMDSLVASIKRGHASPQGQAAGTENLTNEAG